ncbi:MAG: hypothetical protein RL563_1838 [Pseudomonadota bacterium]
MTEQVSSMRLTVAQQRIFQELPKAQSLADIQRLVSWAVDSSYGNGLRCKGIDGVC